MADDPARTNIPQAVVLPPKPFITGDELTEIWETRGMKFRVDEFFKWCTQNGLLPHVRRDSFRAKFHGMLEAFFVKGDSRRDPKFIPPRKQPKLF
jgi:hypothetical protein